jgi:uncharacterized protein RhaS with RHS repeats
MHPSAVTGQNGKTYTYDANGNMLTGAGKTFTWDIDNRVTSINTPGIGTTLFEYDYTGTRTEKIAPAPGGSTIFPFQGYEIEPNGRIVKFIRIGIEIFAAKKRETIGSTTTLFYHNDHLGGVNVITDSAGVKAQLIEYDPWGKVSRSEGPTPGSQPTADPNAPLHRHKSSTQRAASTTTAAGTMTRSWGDSSAPILLYPSPVILRA